MLESICVRRRWREAAENPIDLGMLAEALLFYKRVRVVSDRTGFEQLARAFGPELLVEYVTSGRLLLTYAQALTAIVTRSEGVPKEFHEATVITTRDFEFQHVVPTVFEKYLDRVGRARRLARRLASAVDVVDLSDPQTQPLVLETYSDPEYLLAGARAIFQQYMPEYPNIEQLRFEVQAEQGALTVYSNIDFALANSLYHKRVPQTHSSVTNAMLLADLNVQEDLYFAGQYGAELATTQLRAKLVRLRVQSALPILADSEQPSRFQDLVFDDARALAEAISDGRRNFGDLLQLLEKADKFREWLLSRPPQSDLVKEYFREVTKGSWIDQLPAKVARWALFTGTGVVVDAIYGTAAGVALSAADAFLLDKLVGGWKPSQFVESPLRQFVGK